MMKKILQLSVCLCLSIMINESFAQDRSVLSGYDPHRSFSPQWNVQSNTGTRSPQGEPTSSYWQNQADYKLDCSLDKLNHTLLGTATIRYTNNSPYSLDYLWLQLDQQLFNKESRGQKHLQAKVMSRYGDPSSEFNGGYQLKSVYEQNTDGKTKNALNHIETDTRMQIRLDQPLASKQSITFTIEYQFHIAGYGADRSGILDTKYGEIFSMAQFYPRMCVFDDIRGWNTDPYLGAGEFYLEYGNFDVNITAASDMYVVAGGMLTNPESVFNNEEILRWQQAQSSDKAVIIRNEKEVISQFNAKKLAKKTTKTWNFKLANARDFAWAASTAFMLDGAKISLPSGKTSFALSAYPIESKGNGAWGRSTEYIQQSIRNYSKRWFEYPYPVAVNVASNVGGMEYPGIVFCSSSSTGSSLFGVTDHEFGHTWFPMIVGSNERLYGWMDEGFNTFINSLSDDDFNGGEYNNPDQTGAEWGYLFFQPESESIMNMPDAMRERNIGIALYYKPAFALQLLRKHIIGEARFDFAFRTYIRRWAYKHPTPNDFFRTMEDVSGENLQWFWKSWFIENDRLDQAIVDVQYEQDTQTLVTVSNRDNMVMPLLISYETLSGKKGKMEWPAEIWNNTDQFMIRIPVKDQMKKIVIDEDRNFPDLEYENNIWLAPSESKK